MKAKEEREATWRAATTGREMVRRGQIWLGKRKTRNRKGKVIIYNSNHLSVL